GVEKLFKRIFEVNEGEQLLKTCQCSLFTTAGPLAGRLFVTSEKVVIPLKKIKKAKKHENANKPSKKYLQVVTDDDFEFWFVGFPNYKKAFRSLMQALSIL
ncbi:GEM-like protein 4, partial [Bienertia sinuspersici]